MVEDVLGKSSDEFMSEHGGQGKPLVLWATREYCGMTLREIGDCLGGTHYAAVSGAIRRFEEKSEKSRQTKKVMKDVQEILNVQTCPISISSGGDVGFWRIRRETGE